MHNSLINKPSLKLKQEKSLRGELGSLVICAETGYVTLFAGTFCTLSMDLIRSSRSQGKPSWWLLRLRQLLRLIVFTYFSLW